MNPSSIPALDQPESQPFDLMRVPGLGHLFRWRYARPLLQLPLLIVSVVMILHGLFGPTLAPKNLATTLSWLHFRGVLVLVLLCAGNFFCLACPFMLVRQMARRFFKPRFNWPRALRNKWISVALFVLILFTYELFDLWSSPWWTAWLIIAYFLTVLVVDGFFKHASFCKFVCPIGQFNFVASTLSPFEVKVREPEVCVTCHTKDCIRGRREPVSDLVTIRGCELALFQPRKVGNMDCTFCLDCVHACPHDNIGILSRMPGDELLTDPLRSGIGYFSRRKGSGRAGNRVYFWRAAECFWHGQSGLCSGELAGKNAAREPRGPGARPHFHFLSDPRTCRPARTGSVVDAQCGQAASAPCCRWW